MVVLRDCRLLAVIDGIDKLPQASKIFLVEIDHQPWQVVDLRHVRWFISGGAPLPRHLIDVYRARGVILRQGRLVIPHGDTTLEEGDLWWVETPSNPKCLVTDIAAVAASAAGRGVVVAAPPGEQPCWSSQLKPILHAV